MRTNRFISLALIGLILLVTLPAVTAADLSAPVNATHLDFPVSDWWLVVHDQCADTLHWVNADGEYAAIARPVMTNEAPTAPCTARDLHISQDGRYLVQTAALTTGRTGVGFYDLQLGQWLAIHQAEPNEFAVIGDRYASNASNQIAIGFATNQGAPIRAWRVILFDMTTGAMSDELRSDGPEIASFVGGEFLATELTIPYVTLFTDASAGNTAIDIRFQGFEGVTPFGALRWYPAGAPGVAQELISSPYSAQDLDMLPTGAAIFTYEDAAYPLGQPVGTAPNTVETNAVALIQPTPANPFPNPQLFFADGASTLYGAQWGADGRIALFRRYDGTSQQTHWLKMGTAVLIPLPGNPGAIFGVPTGFVYDTPQGVYYQGENAAAAAGPIFQSSTPGGSLSFVWATPYGSPPLGITALANTGPGLPQFVTATPNIVPPAATEDPTTGPCRASSGDNTNINVRSGPGTNYNVLGQMAAGTTLPVIGYNADWYVVNYAGSQGWMAGWVVELLGNCSALPQMVAPPSPIPPTAASAEINFYVESNDGTCATLAWQVSNIESVYFEGTGVTGTGSQVVCPAMPTTYTLTVNKLDGTTETRTLTVSPTAAAPDLFVSEFSLDPNPPVQGQPVDVRVGVYNQGNAPASGTFHVAWRGGENFATESCGWNINGLVANGGRILTCSFTYGSWYGNINTKVQVDTANTIPESNEGNNIYLQNISVSQAP